MFVFFIRMSIHAAVSSAQKLYQHEVFHHYCIVKEVSATESAKVLILFCQVGWLFILYLNPQIIQ